MIGNVQILKNSGESLMSNGLAHFQFNDSKKKYIIYSFGEQVNDYMKIHVGYEDAPVTDEGITSSDSERIKSLIEMIGSNKDISSIVTFLPLNSELYHIHDKVKNILLPVQAFNNIISAQQRGQIKTASSEEPVLQENKFFDSSSLNEPKQEVMPNQEESIFAKPLQPVIDTTEGSALSVNDNPKEETLNQPQNFDVQNTSVIENVSLGDSEKQDEITDEEARIAIKAVEEAQETIKSNVELIKKFINQRSNNKGLEQLNANDVSSLEGEQKNPQVNVSEYDVVKNMELAPQPEIPSGILTDEPALTSDSAPVNITGTQASTNASLDNSGVQNIPANPQNIPEIGNVVPEGVDEITNPNPQPQGYNFAPSVNANQNLAATPEIVQDYTSTLNEANLSTPQPEGPIEYIDTKNMQNLAQNDASSAGYIDTLPPIGENAPQPTAPKVNTLGVDNGSNGSLIKLQSIPVTNDNSTNKDAFVIPQIDTSVPGGTPQVQQAPVVMPDGQNQDINQGLVLTPDAFNQAA